MQLGVSDIIIVLVSILVSMTLHEAMHGFVSHWLGDDTAAMEGRLTLNPLAHIDPIATVALPLILLFLGLPPFGAAKPVPFNPNKVRWGEWGAALVGLAGPLTNLALALIGGLIVRLLGSSLDSMFAIGLEAFVSVNVAFFLFNMIPFPPLDGSRLIYAIAPDGVRTVMRSIEGFGLMGILVFMFFFYEFGAQWFSELFKIVYAFIVGNVGF